tara:strand:- start:1986 stop:2420 length:435 start_codon:yes stop_codon:yes gene_type:complete
MAGIAGLLNQLQSAFDTTNQQLVQSLDRIRLLEEQARQTSQPSIGGSVPVNQDPGYAVDNEPGAPPSADLSLIEGGFDNRVPISTMPTPPMFGGGGFPGSGRFPGFFGRPNRPIAIPFGSFGQPQRPAFGGLGTMFGNIFRGRM